MGVEVPVNGDTLFPCVRAGVAATVDGALAPSISLQNERKRLKLLNAQQSHTLLFRIDRPKGRPDQPPLPVQGAGPTYGGGQAGTSRIRKVPRALLLVVCAGPKDHVGKCSLGGRTAPAQRQPGRLAGRGPNTIPPRVPLTKLQSEIARLIAVNRSPSSHLAGAAGLFLEPNSLRTSDDLDYFHDAEALVGKAFSADRALLEASGHVVEVTLSQPGFVRAIVSRGGGATKVEWAHDSSWRFLPPVADPRVGYRLHPLDLAINKVLALAGRDEPRDFLDAIFVHRTYLSLGSLCWAAAGKDPGFSPSMLVEMLARKGRYRDEDFAGLSLTSQPDLGELKDTWLEAIAGARRLVRDLPTDDSGCLYWNPAKKKFVTPDGDLRRLVRHFGSHGGVLPSIGDEIVLSGNPAARRRLAATTSTARTPSIKIRKKHPRRPGAP